MANTFYQDKKILKALPGSSRLAVPEEYEFYWI
jgi:hypothetical protein